MLEQSSVAIMTFFVARCNNIDDDNNDSDHVNDNNSNNDHNVNCSSNTDKESCYYNNDDY